MQFRMNNVTDNLPAGYFLESKKIPSLKELNNLFRLCSHDTYPPRKLLLALEKSDFFLYIIEESSGSLVGFVRGTTDYGLNVNLWNLVARPGKLQQKFLLVLVSRTLQYLRREIPGCSISISASSESLQALRENGFLIDPGGIRAMGLKISLF